MKLPEVLTWARENNIVAIPFNHGSKFPSVEWKQYQSRKPSDQELNNWFGTTKPTNIGFVCGAISDNLVVVDFDSAELFDAFNIHDTTIVKTKQGYHAYFKSKFPVKSTRFEFVGHTAGIDIKAEGGVVVAPPSKHPSGAIYEFVNDIAPAKVDGDFLHGFKEKCSEVEKEKGWQLKKISERIDVNTLLSGSEKGNRNDFGFKLATYHRTKNFNTEKTLKKLQEWNLKNNPPLSESELEVIVWSAYKNTEPYSYIFVETSESGKLPAIFHEDFIKKEFPKQKWVVDGYIPRESVCILAGKRAGFKTWIALDLAISIASGKPFLDVFETHQGNVLYVNEENSAVLFSERLKYFKENGNKLPELSLSYLNLEGFRFDKLEWREKLIEFSKEYGISTIICDPVRRTHDFEENDAGQISLFFTDIIQPLRKELGVTFVFLHHLRKGFGGKYASDKMDELRGSSELANYVDSILLSERLRESNRFNLKHLKSRSAPEQPPAQFLINFEDNAVNFTFEGTVKDTIKEEEACAKAIIDWTIEKQKPEFRTCEVKLAMKTLKFGERTVTRALSNALKENLLEKVKRGIYRTPSDYTLEDAIKEKLVVEDDYIKD